VHQLFTNVLANALKFSRTDVPVIIRISATQVNSDQIHSIEDVRPGTYWQISFSDNGIGFEQQYENRIFELFQRLHGKNEYVGTGIGLAICKKIVHNHHGHITATGRPGEGSVFNIYLPVTGTTSRV
jgi:signal transduction histidine kinase